MLSAIRPVRTLLLAIFMLMAGSGFMATYVSIRLERAGNADLIVGAVGTAYFLGLVIGSIRAGSVVRRAGHIRAFTAFVSLFSASTLGYALHDEPLLWGSLRLVDGFCVAGVYVCLESWLNERSEGEGRGMVLAGYMVALYSGQALGQFLLNLSEQKPSLPFVVASILISLSAIPVALTRMHAPLPENAVPLPVTKLYQISPLGIVGAATTGLMLGAFYALGAVFARRLGMALPEVAVFMSTVILGGVVLQWPLGLLSDRFDRRRVIVLAFFGAMLAGIGVIVAGGERAVLLGLAAAFGGLSFALYPLCVAHANDHLKSEQRVAATGGLILAYSAGAAIGPLAGSGAMALAGADGLFAFIASAAGAALLFGLWRQLRTMPVPAERQQIYQVLPRTTPIAATLDPRVPGHSQERS